MQPTSCLSKVWKKTSLVFTLTTVLAYSSNSYLLNWLYNKVKHRTPKICSVLTWLTWLCKWQYRDQFSKLAGDMLRNLFGLSNFKNHPEIHFHFMLQRESDWAMTSFIHTKHSRNKYHMIDELNLCQLAELTECQASTTAVLCPMLPSAAGPSGPVHHTLRVLSCRSSCGDITASPPSPSEAESPSLSPGHGNCRCPLEVANNGMKGWILLKRWMEEQRATGRK